MLKINTSLGKAIMYEGKPLPECPKSYKKYKVIEHSVTDLLSNRNDYNPSWMTIYKTNTGKFKYEIYRDGSFYPYYGDIKFLNNIK